MTRFILISILVLTVFTSKQILLYNEEIVVALSFTGFVIFCQKMLADTVKATFDERQASIRTELEAFINSRESVLTMLIQEHEVGSTSKRLSTQMIGEACIHDMITRCAPKSKQRVEAILSQQYGQQLNGVALQESSRASVQVHSTITSLISTVYDEFRFAKLRKHQSKLVTQNIALLGL